MHSRLKNNNTHSEMKLFLWTVRKQNTSERMNSAQVSRWVLAFFVSYPGCVSLTSEVMCVLLLSSVCDYRCWQHRSSTRTACLHVGSDHHGDLISSGVKRSPGINRSVAAGEQNNKWPGVSQSVPSPDIFVVSWSPHERKQRDSRLFCTGWKIFSF